MRTTAQTISLWIGLGFGLVLFLAFLLFPGFIPPMSPAKTATEVAAFYAGHTAAIRASMVIINLCGIMLVPFFMVVVYQMKRMATPTQVLAYAYLSAVASGATLLAIADLFWLIAAFRPGRDPQLILLLNDMAWIVFTAPVGAFVAQNVCLALAVHLDRQRRPIFPRWVAPFSLVTAAAVAPAAFAATMRTGPLAWNGAVSFWLRLAAYGSFFVVMLFVLRAAIAREAREGLPDSVEERSRQPEPAIR